MVNKIVTKECTFAALKGAAMAVDEPVAKPLVDEIAGNTELLRDVNAKVDTLLGERSTGVAVADTDITNLRPNAYLVKIAKRYGEAHTLFTGNAPIPLRSFYVPNSIHVDITTMRRGKFATNADLNLLDDIGIGRVRYASSFTEILKLPNCLIITGVAGMGKTSYLKHILLEAVDKYDELGYLSVFVGLKNYAESGKKLIDFVTAFDETISVNVLMSFLKSGKCAIFFDGLDELTYDEKRKFSSDLDMLIPINNENRFYITSRPRGKTEDFHTFHKVDLLPFTLEQALEYVDKLNFQSNLPDIKRDFCHALKTSLFETHKEYAGNPFLLSIIPLACIWDSNQG